MIVSILLIVGLTLGDRVQTQVSNTTARLRGLCVVDEKTAWATGASGTVLLTTDAGDHWNLRPVPGGATLDFRDVEAFDDQTACILSIGPGDRSRIYQTADGGARWECVFTMSDPRGFLDAIAFWDKDRGIALGDPIEGHFTILTTDDGGKTWQAPEKLSMPASLEGEGAFAASGTCLVVGARGHAWFGTGGGGVARLFHSLDWGKTWSVVNAPIKADNTSSGIFSVAFRDEAHGVAIGGDYLHPDAPGPRIAITADGGKTWAPPGPGGPRAYRSCAAWLPGTGAIVAVGPSGCDVAENLALDWTSLSDRGFHAIAFAPGARVGWAVGEAGAIARVVDPLKSR